MGQAPRIYSMLDSNFYSKQLSLQCSIELHKMCVRLNIAKLLTLNSYSRSLALTRRVSMTAGYFSITDSSSMVSVSVF